MDGVYYIVTFSAGGGGVKGERTLLDAGLNVNSLPLPKMVSAGCGVVVKFDPKDYEAVKEALTKAGAPVMDYFEVEQKGLQQFVELL